MKKKYSSYDIVLWATAAGIFILSALLGWTLTHFIMKFW